MSLAGVFHDAKFVLMLHLCSHDQDRIFMAQQILASYADIMDFRSLKPGLVSAAPSLDICTSTDFGMFCCVIYEKKKSL